MVDMQMRAQHRVDRLAREAGGGEIGEKRPLQIVPGRDAAALFVVAEAGVDDDAPRGRLDSSGWVDLTREPMVVSVPDTGGRYYLLPMLDMWTDVFASPGWRTTGTKAGISCPSRPGGMGRVPADFTRINAPTPYVWIIGRTKTDGPADYDAVHAVQKGFKITPLSSWGKPASPVKANIDPSVDVKTPPKSRSTRCRAQIFRLRGRVAKAASTA